MKKSLFVIMALAVVFAFTSCNKENSYTGKYKGTYTFFKQSGSASNPDSTKTGKTVPILQVYDTQVLLYDLPERLSSSASPRRQPSPECRAIC